MANSSNALKLGRQLLAGKKSKVVMEIHRKITVVKN